MRAVVSTGSFLPLDSMPCLAFSREEDCGLVGAIHNIAQKSLSLHRTLRKHLLSWASLLPAPPRLLRALALG